eukprot:GGOE01006547.1.p5 GENE.GGOE01006547.1~~GGOE01006547.1.p5  ORF type:complete len:121 (-),score=2.72 GGOE01006547.1:1003-1365(-)
MDFPEGRAATHIYCFGSFHLHPAPSHICIARAFLLLPPCVFGSPIGSPFPSKIGPWGIRLLALREELTAENRSCDTRCAVEMQLQRANSHSCVRLCVYCVRLCVMSVERVSVCGCHDLQS